MEKDGDYLLLVCFCICTFCMYRSPCQQLSEMKKMRRECREEWNSPVWGVCGCSFLGMSCVGSWLSCGDSILLFVPCDLGSVRGCKSISAILLCRIAFCLVPVGRHWWACLFWLVTGTNAHGCSFGCILFLVLFVFMFFFLIREGLLFLSQHYTCYMTRWNGMFDGGMWYMTKLAVSFSYRHFYQCDVSIINWFKWLSGSQSIKPIRARDCCHDRSRWILNGTDSALGNDSTLGLVQFAMEISVNAISGAWIASLSIACVFPVPLGSSIWMSPMPTTLSIWPSAATMFLPEMCLYVRNFDRSGQ